MCIWRRKWQSTPVLLPGKLHGQRSLVGYSPWGRKELDMTVRLHPLTHSLTHSAGKESTGNAGDLGSISGLGRSPGAGNSYPLQFSGLKNSMERVGHD